MVGQEALQNRPTETRYTILEPSTGHGNITQTSVNLWQCEIPFWHGLEPQNHLSEHQELKDPPLGAGRTQEGKEKKKRLYIIGRIRHCSQHELNDQGQLLHRL